MIFAIHIYYYYYYSYIPYDNSYCMLLLYGFSYPIIVTIFISHRLLELFFEGAFPPHGQPSGSASLPRKPTAAQRRGASVYQSVSGGEDSQETMHN